MEMGWCVHLHPNVIRLVGPVLPVLPADDICAT